MKRTSLIVLLCLGCVALGFPIGFAARGSDDSELVRRTRRDYALQVARDRKENERRLDERDAEHARALNTCRDSAERIENTYHVALEECHARHGVAVR